MEVLEGSKELQVTESKIYNIKISKVQNRKQIKEHIGRVHEKNSAVIHNYAANT